mmetsp:Transcript_73882/g.238794  ORF Transcript_73882/g.238794 Transcript_73882/m.238794 type:complete len:272 (+) Transcript_73882:717-1532(+)
MRAVHLHSSVSSNAAPRTSWRCRESTSPSAAECMSGVLPASSTLPPHGPPAPRQPPLAVPLAAVGPSQRPATATGGVVSGTLSVASDGARSPRCWGRNVWTAGAGFDLIVLLAALATPAALATDALAPGDVGDGACCGSVAPGPGLAALAPLVAVARRKPLLVVLGAADGAASGRSIAGCPGFRGVVRHLVVSAAVAGDALPLAAPGEPPRRVPRCDVGGERLGESRRPLAAGVAAHGRSRAGEAAALQAAASNASRGGCIRGRCRANATP